MTISTKFEILYKWANGCFYATVNKLKNGSFMYILYLLYLGPCVGRLYYAYDLFLLVISLVYFVRFEVYLFSIG